MLEAFAIKVMAYVITFTVIGVLGWLVGQGGGKERVEAGARLLGFNTFFRGLAIVTDLMLLGLCVSTVRFPPQTADEINERLLLFAFLTLLAGFLTLEGFKTKVLLTPEGIGKTHWWYRTRFVCCEEVDNICCRPLFGNDYAVYINGGRLALSVPPANIFGPVEWFMIACRSNLRPEQYPQEFRTSAQGNDDGRGSPSTEV